MRAQKRSEQYMNVRRERADRDALNTTRIAAAGAAGRTVYREEFERDFGPDLDEPVDGTESGHEF
jgi:hypothetical protein